MVGVLALLHRRYAYFLQGRQKYVAAAVGGFWKMQGLRDRVRVGGMCCIRRKDRENQRKIEIIPKLLKTLYEDKLSGKTSEDNYCVLSQEYSDEREQLQKKILKLRRKLTEMGEKENEREEFIHAIRKFMEMRTLTKQVLNELIDRIDVYETQGTGKNKTQRLVIYYKFVGYLDIDPTQCRPNYTADIREGVAIEYISCEPPENLKELFPEGYGVDDDSFEEEELEQA